MKMDSCLGGDLLEVEIEQFIQDIPDVDVTRVNEIKLTGQSILEKLKGDQSRNLFNAIEIGLVSMTKDIITHVKMTNAHLTEQL